MKNENKTCYKNKITVDKIKEVAFFIYNKAELYNYLNKRIKVDFSTNRLILYNIKQNDFDILNEILFSEFDKIEIKYYDEYHDEILTEEHDNFSFKSSDKICRKIMDDCTNNTLEKEYNFDMLWWSSREKCLQCNTRPDCICRETNFRINN